MIFSTLIYIILSSNISDSNISKPLLLHLPDDFHGGNTGSNPVSPTRTKRRPPTGGRLFVIDLPLGPFSLAVAWPSADQIIFPADVPALGGPEAKAGAEAPALIQRNDFYFFFLVACFLGARVVSTRPVSFLRTSALPSITFTSISVRRFLA